MLYLNVLYNFVHKVFIGRLEIIKLPTGKRKITIHSIVRKFAKEVIIMGDY